MFVAFDVAAVEQVGLAERLRHEELADGMRFVQYYFGLPLAMILISIVFVPIFRRLKVYTAYEYLEERFDVKTRTFTSFLTMIISTILSVKF